MFNKIVELKSIAAENDLLTNNLLDIQKQNLQLRQQYEDSLASLRQQLSDLQN